MFPTHPQALSSEWLTRVLRRAEVLDEAAVIGFDCETDGLSEAIATRVVRVRPSYDRVERAAPATLIAKFATDRAATRELMSRFGGYEREIRFYRELAAKVSLPTAKCYAAELELASAAFVILLEDLAPAAPCTVIEGLLPEQVELAIRELARFHATWWNDARLESLRWLWPDVQSLSLLRELFSSALSKRQKELEAETPMLARVAAWLAESLAQSPAEPPPLKPPLTLVHSDFHVSNLFFPRPEGRFAVVDWQTVRVAETGATDLARLLVSGLGIERRRAHQDRLLGLYHEALSKNGVTDFSLAELRASYERSLLDQVLGQVIVTAAHDQPSALLELQGRRIEAALADSDFAKIEAPN